MYQVIIDFIRKWCGVCLAVEMQLELDKQYITPLSLSESSFGSLGQGGFWCHSLRRSIMMTLAMRCRFSKYFMVNRQILPIMKSHASILYCCLIKIILYHSQKLEWQGKRVKVLRLVG